MPIKVLFDYQIFHGQVFGGISRYFSELIKSYNKDTKIEIKLALFASENHYLLQQPNKAFFVINHRLINFNRFLYKVLKKILGLLNKYKAIQVLKSQDFAVFHPTYYEPYFLNYIGDKPFVLTVYDMIHEKFSEYFKRPEREIQNKKLLIQKATKIIAISKSTKQDLIDLYNIEPSKIEVVYLASSLDSLEVKPSSFNVPNNYLLFVGHRRGYKNFELFIKAVAQILKQDQSLHLICVGGGPINRDESLLIQKLAIVKQVLQVSVTDRQLAYLYKNAVAFIFPSLYEGFGIPILESFSLDCPLICSNTSSFPEVAQDAALYFDPYSEESIYLAINKLINDSSLRQELIEKGRQRLKFFSWQKTALETEKVYQQISSGV